MKRSYQLLSLLVLLLLCAALPGQEFTGAEAEKRVPGAKMVLMGDQSEVPTFVVFREDARVPVAEFEEWERKVFGYSSSISFERGKSMKDEAGFTHIWRQQTFNGVKVDGKISVIHTKNGLVHSVNGNTVIDLGNSHDQAKISKETALKTMLNQYNVDLKSYQSDYMWVNTAVTNPVNSSEYLTNELTYVTNKNKDYLAYRIFVHSEIYNIHEVFRVDAATGKIVSRESNISSCNNGTAITSFDAGTRPISTDAVAGGFVLHNDCFGNSRARNIRTRDGALTGPDYLDANNLWFTGGEIRTASSAHLQVSAAYDYYMNAHNREGMQANNGTVTTFISNARNARQFTNTTNIEVGTGLTIANNDDDFSAQDIIGHEYTHGVLSFSGILGLDHDTRALHEGISDIFGVLIEAEENNGAIDWTILEDTEGGLLERSLANPAGDNIPFFDIFGNVVGTNPSPDTYLVGDWTGNLIHNDGGVVRHWFFLLSEGGNGTNDNGDNFSVNGIGTELAADILYTAINAGLFGNSPDYPAARVATIQALSMVNIPACDRRDVENSVIDAWFAVGVGNDTPAPPPTQQDISISNLTTNLPGNTASPGETFTASFNLSGQPYDAGTYVGFFLESWCTSSVLYSPFDYDYEIVTCGTTTNHTAEVTLPQGIAPGQYTLIARSDAFNWVNETNTWNDRTCRTITIQDDNPAPDLVPTGQSASPSTVQAGNSINAGVYLQNQGSAFAGSSTMGYYLSTNSTYGGGDIPLGTEGFSSIYPGQNRYENVSLTIPGNTSPGNYYILFKADTYNQVDEGNNEGNNVSARLITVTAPPANLPDLIITGVNPGPNFGSPPYVNRGTNLSVSFNLVNQGSNPVSNSTVKIYLSSNSNSPSNSTPLRTLYSQQPGNKSTTIYIPSNQSPGFWYILVRADANNNVTESVESNNYNYGFCQISSNFNKPAADPAMATNTANASDGDISYDDGVSTATAVSATAEIKTTEVKLYPNPTSDVFTVTYPVQEANEVSISLRSSTGQLIRTALLSPAEQTGKWQQQVSELPPGVYSLTWNNGDQRITRRLVIQ